MKDLTFKREDDFAAMNIDAAVEGARSLEDLITVLTGMKEAYDGFEEKDKRKIDISELSYDELPMYLSPSDFIGWCELPILHSLMNIPDVEITDLDLMKVCPDADAYGCLVDWMHDELEEAILNMLGEKVAKLSDRGDNMAIEAYKANKIIERLNGENQHARQ